jgi:hypothetical protein
MTNARLCVGSHSPPVKLNVGKDTQYFNRKAGLYNNTLIVNNSGYDSSCYVVLLDSTCRNVCFRLGMLNIARNQVLLYQVKYSVLA